MSISLTSREISNLLCRPHTAIRNRIKSRLTRHPELLKPLFEPRAFINDRQRGDIEYVLGSAGIDYICGEFGQDGKRLRELVAIAEAVDTP